MPDAKTLAFGATVHFVRHSKEARAALEKGDVTGLLKWVSKEDEKEIRTVFAASVAVRAKGKEAANWQRRFLFETLVRVHRAGEGGVV